MSTQKYILLLISIFSLLCMCAIGLSFYVNPYKIKSFFPSTPLENYFGGTRTSKAIAITESNYNAFILGSSRSEIGIDPNNQLWGDLNVYNASLAGSSFSETYKVFEKIIKHNKPELLVLALDYSLFSTARTTSADFNLSRFDNSNNYFLSFFKERLSKEAIEKSFRALKYKKQGLPPKHIDGQKSGYLTFTKKISTVGQHALVQNTLIKRVIRNNENYSAPHHSKLRFQQLSQLMKTCLEEEIELIIFISPIHALQLMAFHEMGLWSEFLNWKKELVKITKQSPQVPLYDFTNLSPFITENIPNKKARSMHWFWETSHYKSTLGDKIIEKILGHAPKDSAFGAKLNEKNITDELVMQNAILHHYIEKNTTLLYELEELMNKD
ncbi:MAG: hypothetical protein ACPG4B_09615 [Cycloclasticus sp.]